MLRPLIANPVQRALPPHGGLFSSEVSGDEFIVSFDRRNSWSLSGRNGSTSGRTLASFLPGIFDISSYGNNINFKYEVRAYVQTSGFGDEGSKFAAKCINKVLLIPLLE